MTELNDKLLKFGQLLRFKSNQDTYNGNTYLGKEANAASASKLNNATAVGGATQPVYFTENGVPEAITYTLGKSVPADAEFTDTTYENASATDAGLMSAADYNKLDGIAAGAQANVIEGLTIGGTDATVTDKKIALGNAAAATTEATLTNGTNLPTGAAVTSYVTSLGYQTASDVSSAISSALSTVMDYKGVKATVAELPSSDNKQGDVWHVTADSSEYAWNGSAWEELGVTFDASGYVQSSDLVYADNDDIDGLFS